ncbi:hypothetical protein LCGC14_2976950, partial [marine sediment metagenome]
MPPEPSFLLFNETLIFQLGYVDSDGTSNFVQIGSNSDATAVLTINQTSYSSHIHVVNDTAVPAGKRLWLKVIADSTGGAGSFPEIRFYYDDPGHHVSFGVSGDILGNFVQVSGDAMTGTLSFFQGTPVGSTNDMTLGDGNVFDITGVTTINTIASKGIGTIIYLQFDGILQLTHSADLFLPTAANITTAAGDIATCYEYASADWRCTYQRADGTALVSAGLTGITEASGNDNTVALGAQALDSLTTGQGLGNTAVGFDAGTAVTSGDYNTLMGEKAGDALTTGDNNVAIGTEALGAGTDDPTNSE